MFNFETRRIALLGGLTTYTVSGFWFAFLSLGFSFRVSGLGFAGFGFCFRVSDFGFSVFSRCVVLVSGFGLRKIYNTPLNRTAAAVDALAGAEALCSDLRAVAQQTSRSKVWDTSKTIGQI